jgi:hypothetical protein
MGNTITTPKPTRELQSAPTQPRCLRPSLHQSSGPPSHQDTRQANQLFAEFETPRSLPIQTNLFYLLPLELLEVIFKGFKREALMNFPLVSRSFWRTFNGWLVSTISSGNYPNRTLSTFFAHVIKAYPQQRFLKQASLPYSLGKLMPGFLSLYVFTSDLALPFTPFNARALIIKQGKKKNDA